MEENETVIEFELDIDIFNALAKKAEELDMSTNEYIAHIITISFQEEFNQNLIDTLLDENDFVNFISSGGKPLVEVSIKENG